MPEDLEPTVVPPQRPAVEPRGHLPTDFGDTRVISSPRTLPERAPLAAAEPTGEFYYSFRVGSRAEPIALDRPCFVGRRPSSPRIGRGDAPRLLRVPSPLKEVSATHLELRQTGSSVIVTDMRSTNGSVVMVPGSVPRKLRQGESVVVSAGTLVDIGDDNVLQILPRERLPR